MNSIHRPAAFPVGERHAAAAWRDVAWLVAGTLLVRGAIYLLTDNQYGDPDARAIWGAFVHREWPLITSGFWLPFQPYAIALLMYPLHDPLLAGRLLSLVTGVAAVIPFYFLVLQGFDRRTAVLAGALFAVYGLHAGLSVIVMTEAPFVLLCLTGLLAFVREMRAERPRLGPILLAAALLALGGGLRHEAWQLTGLLTLWLLIDARTRRFVVPFAILGFSMYGLWTLGNMLAGNGFMYALTGVAQQKEKELHDSAVSNLVKWAFIFVESPGPAVAALGLGGLWLAVRERRLPLYPAVLSLLMIAPYVLLSIVKPVWRPQQRYVVFMVILLLPYAAAAFWHWFGRADRALRALAVLFVLTVATQGLAYSRYSALWLPVRDYERADVKLWTWMAANLAPADHVVIEDIAWRSPGILLRSGKHVLPNETVFARDPPARLGAAIGNTGATVLVLASGERDRPALQGRPLKELYRNDDYRVVRIGPAQ